MSVVVEQLSQLVEGAARRAGCELVEVSYLKEGAQWVLRVFIDKPPGAEGGVGLDECQAVSQDISALLDVHDPLPHAYRLEVSSPGLDRPLTRREDYQRFAGRLVLVTCYQPLDGRKKFTGTLRGLEGDDVVLLLQEPQQEMRIPLAMVAKARLEIEF